MADLRNADRLLARAKIRLERRLGRSRAPAGAAQVTRAYLVLDARRDRLVVEVALDSLRGLLMSGTRDRQDVYVVRWHGNDEVGVHIVRSRGDRK